jgi:hypothetical protein
MLTQLIKQGSHSFGFRFIISREKHFSMFGTFRGNIGAKFLHAASPEHDKQTAKTGKLP